MKKAFRPTTTERRTSVCGEYKLPPTIASMIWSSGTMVLSLNKRSNHVAQ
jgi:hypothetical protein